MLGTKSGRIEYANIIRSASLTTWTTQLSTLERRAAEHERYSGELISQISDPLRNISLRYEELRKNHAEYAVKLEKEKEAAFGITSGSHNRVVIADNQIKWP